MRNKKTIFSMDDILTLLPHRPPFLLVDRITNFKKGKFIESEHKILEDQPWFKGHFPNNPIMPGVIVTDALAQTSGLLWGFTKRETENNNDSNEPELFYLASANIKYVTPSYPGETLVMTSRADKNFGILYTYTVEATVGRNVIAKGTLTLAMVKDSI